MADSTKKTQAEITIEDLGEGLTNQRVIVAGQGANLLDTLLKAKVKIATSCGGQGTCGTCRVYILSGSDALSSKTEIEIEMATDRGFESNERLSCQCEIKGSISIKIAATGS